MHLIEKNVSFTMCATLKVYKSDWHFSRGLPGGVLGGCWEKEHAQRAAADRLVNCRANCFQ